MKTNNNDIGLITFGVLSLMLLTAFGLWLNAPGPLTSESPQKITLDFSLSNAVICVSMTNTVDFEEEEIFVEPKSLPMLNSQWTLAPAWNLSLALYGSTNRVKPMP